MKRRNNPRRIAHERDPYVRQARQSGYRSRAAYKLIELDRRHRLLSPGMTVLELGAAPGGWTQVVVERVGPKGTVIAIDTLPMEPIPGVTAIEGDISEPNTRKALIEALRGKPVDLVLSDLAPNLTGIAATDQARSAALVEMAMSLAADTLREGGDLLVKAFQGAGLEELVAQLKRNFVKVQRCKPDASRDRSRELYLLARSYRVRV